MQADEDTHSKIPVFGGVRHGEFPYTAIILAGKFLSF